jgi:1,4-alpha-glucan branching enzyme
VKKKLSEEAKAKTKTKNIRFNLYAPEAKRVFLAGDFNHWDVDTLLMKRDNKGTWEASFALPPGRCGYRFWVDGVCMMTQMPLRGLRILLKARIVSK